MEQTLPKKFIAQVDAIVSAKLSDESFSIEELSNLLHLSNSQVFRKIKTKTGLSPSCYIRKKRLEESHQLIVGTNHSITKVAYMVGFNCNTYFSTCFSEFYGYAPSHLRKHIL